MAEETHAASGACGVGEPNALDQRFAMYIVISKPKRKSVAVGVCHCMGSLLTSSANTDGVLGEFRPAKQFGANLVARSVGAS